MGYLLGQWLGPTHDDSRPGKTGFTERLLRNVRQFVDQLLAEVNGPNPARGGIRVVYSLRSVESVGNNTQYMSLTPEDLKELKALSERLNREAK